MKKIIVFLMGVFVSIFSATAQDITEFFKTQKANDDVEYIRIEPEVLKLTSKAIAFASIFSGDLDKSDEGMLDLISDLDDIEFIVAKNKDVNLLKALKKTNFFASKDYKYINAVSHENEDIFVYAKKSNDSLIHNLVVALSDTDDDATIVANIKGNIHPEQIEKVIKLTRQSKKNEKHTQILNVSIDK